MAANQQELAKFKEVTALAYAEQGIVFVNVCSLNAAKFFLNAYWDGIFFQLYTADGISTREGCRTDLEVGSQDDRTGSPKGQSWK
jgi:hypothetical protein